MRLLLINRSHSAVWKAMVKIGAKEDTLERIVNMRTPYNPQFDITSLLSAKNAVGSNRPIRCQQPQITDSLPRKHPHPRRCTNACTVINYKQGKNQRDVPYGASLWLLDTNSTKTKDHWAKILQPMTEHEVESFEDLRINVLHV